MFRSTPRHRSRQDSPRIGVITWRPRTVLDVEGRPASVQTEER
jgi:hypothetical protein